MADCTSVVLDQSDIDTVTWTAVIAPMSCNHVVIDNLRGATTVLLRTHSATAKSQRSVLAGEVRAFTHAPSAQDPRGMGVNYRFVAGDVVCYLKDSTGARTVDVEFHQ